MRKPDFVSREITSSITGDKSPIDLSEENQTDVVILGYEQRYLRRKVIQCASGKLLLVDLPAALVLENDNCLVIESGGYIRVKSADEKLLEIKSSDAHQLAIFAYHLGNRHLPVQIEPEKLLIRYDHVIEAMLIKLGAHVTPINAPFNPEGGAYGLGRTHGHDHGHNHGQNHEDAPEHDHVDRLDLNGPSDAS